MSLLIDTIKFAILAIIAILVAAIGVAFASLRGLKRAVWQG
jgi:hypothetical protein